MSTRNGKIGCLPAEIREEVNRRLDDRQAGTVILEWLNGLPKVKAVLAERFGSEPVCKQNLSRWRAGGYGEWLARKQIWAEAREELSGQAQRVGENGADLAVAGKGRLTDNLSTLLATRYGSVLLRWDGKVSEELRNKLRVLREMSEGVGMLRRDDLEGARLALDREIAEWKGSGGRTRDAERIEGGRSRTAGAEGQKSRPVTPGHGQSR